MDSALRGDSFGVLTGRIGLRLTAQAKDKLKHGASAPSAVAEEGRRLARRR